MANTQSSDNNVVMSHDIGSTNTIVEEAGSDKGETHQFNEQTNYVPKRAIITIFLACATVDLLALMDQTMLATSLYIIGNALGSTAQVSWIASGYFVTSTVGQLMYGRLSDIWSRKIILLVGLAIFFIGSVASSLAGSVLQLTIFRAFTGIGGGGLMTVAQLIVSDVVPLRERGKYQGILVYYIPSFYQLVYGYSATKAGAMLLPITLLQTASSTLSGLIVHWVGRYRECILFGWLCWAVGLGLMSTLDENTGVDKQIGYSVLIGIGVGNTLQPALIATQAGVNRRDMAVVTSFRNFVRNLGATLGLAVCGTVLNNVLASSLSSLDLDNHESKTLLGNPQSILDTISPSEAERIRSVLIPAYRQGFRVIFLIGAGAASLAFVLAFILMPQVNLTRPDDSRLKEEGRRVYEEKKVKDIH
ncbi:unnamed protein product [Fusarium langsethiae]|nr:unnamed protein product [Fusarium langsethiae]